MQQKTKRKNNRIDKNLAENVFNLTENVCFLASKKLISLI